MLDVADPAERAKAAADLVRSGQAVQFDPAKPPEERTLPIGFVEQFAGAKILVVRNAVLPPVFLNGTEVAALLILQDCTFSSFSAVGTTFKEPINLSGSTFGSCEFRHSAALDVLMSRVTVSDWCSFEHAEVKGDLDLSGAAIASLQLGGAGVGGSLVATAATITGLNAEALRVELLFAPGAHFVEQITFDDVDAGGINLTRAVFDKLFKPERLKARGSVAFDGATFKERVGVVSLSCASLSMRGATVAADASFWDLDANNVLLGGSSFGGMLLFERGHVKGVFDVKGIAIAGDLSLAWIELNGVDLTGIRAASLTLTNLSCADFYSEPPDADEAGLAPRAGTSTFERVSILRATISSLRPKRWAVSEYFRVASSELAQCLMESNEIGELAVTDTKVAEECVLALNSVQGGAHFLNVTVAGSMVFFQNTFGGPLELQLSSFGRLQFSRQPLPAQLTCTSSTVKQLVFERATQKRFRDRADAARYAGCTIDLRNSTYDQIICSVEELQRALVREDSRQQYVVLERALRQAGFDELADGAYRFGRTQYYERLLAIDFGVWLRGAIANFTTGFGLSVARITAVTVAVPLVVFLMLLVSPGTVIEAGMAAPCTAAPAVGVTALAVGQTFVGAGDAKVEFTDCRVLGTVPARGVALMLRILGLVLFPLWIIVATGLLKYAVKSGD